MSQPRTIEAAETFYAEHRERIDADELQVNALAGAVACGISRDLFAAGKKILGISNRRCCVGPVRRLFRTAPQITAADAATPAAITACRQRFRLK